MSEVVHCIDNGPTEGFWGIIKSEMYQMYEITDEASLRYAIKDYLRFYSEERAQDRYHCKTPLEVRQEALASGTPIEYPIPENKRIKNIKRNGAHRKMPTLQVEMQASSALNFRYFTCLLDKGLISFLWYLKIL